jgi:hypothetical protein
MRLHGGPTPGHPSHLSTDHSNHDVDLIAGVAAGDLPSTQAIVARRLVASCADCSRLQADLVSIAAAVRALPARPSAAPRDYRLSADQARRLGRGSVWRRLLRPFAATRSGIRPLAASLTSLGLAGVLVAALLPALGSPALSGVTRNAAPVPAEVPQNTNAPGRGEDSAVNGGGPTSSAGDLPYAQQASGAPKEGLPGYAGAEPGAPSDLSVTSAPVGLLTWIWIGSTALLAVGLALFGLRIAARRLR